jgi:hypothetical protein
MKKYLIILHDAIGGSEPSRQALRKKLSARLGLSGDLLDRIFNDLPAILAERGTEKEAEDLRSELELDGALVEVLEENGSDSMEELFAAPASAPAEAAAQASGSNEIEFDFALPQTPPPADEENLSKLDLALSDLSHELDQALGVSAEDERLLSEPAVPSSPAPSAAAAGAGASLFGDLQFDTSDAAEEPPAAPAQAPVESPGIGFEPPNAAPAQTVEVVEERTGQPPPPPQPAVTRGVDAGAAPVPKPYLEGESFKPRRRKSVFLHPVFLMIAGGAVAGCFALIFFLHAIFVGPGRDSTPDYRELVAALLDQQARRVPTSIEAEGKSRPASADTPQVVWRGVEDISQAKVELRMIGADTEKFLLSLDVLPKAPPKLTPLQIVSGMKPAPWLERITVEELSAPVKMRNLEARAEELTFSGEAPAKAYVNHEGEMVRLPLKFTATGSYVRETDQLKLQWSAVNRDEAPAGLTKDSEGRFVLRYSGELTLGKGSAPQPPAPDAAKSPAP